jgi:uncharacterized protein YjbI with pentapeptide repeats
LEKNDLVRRINKGVDSWNAWKCKWNKKIASIEITDPSTFDCLDKLDIDLSDCDFKGKCLSRYDFSRVNFSDSCFIEANLSETNFTDSFLLSSDFSKANLTCADLKRANLEGAIFNGANLLNADLTNANLEYAKLNEANLKCAILTEANFEYAELCGAILWEADLTKTKLSHANLWQADLWQANMELSILRDANLHGTNLKDVNLSGADLRDANLREARLIETDFSSANLAGCRIYGVSVWNVKTNLKTDQSNLIITKDQENPITLDNLNVAQFIYLILENNEIRNVIDTVTSKVVLILGRFTPERKEVLELIRKELRKYRYVPVLFDFEKPNSRSFIETVSTLAHLSKFVIVDLTDAKIVLQELPHIVQNIAIPVKPLLFKSSEKEPVTLADLRRNQKSILKTFIYSSPEELIKNMEIEVIIPAEKQYKKLSK